MGRPYDSRDKLLELMSDGKPRISRQVAEQLHFTDRAAESVCHRCWKAGLLLRTVKPIHERNSSFSGRAVWRKLGNGLLIPYPLLTIFSVIFCIESFVLFQKYSPITVRIKVPILPDVWVAGEYRFL